MAGMLRVPRSRGALSGVLLVLLGLWGGLIPFVGPYFHFAYTPGTAWTYTAGRLWLEILPAAGTVLGGLILLRSRVRPVGMFGAWLAAASGAWFAVGRSLSPLWNPGGTLALGTPIGSSTLIRTLVEVSYFTGLGVLIVFLAAMSIGRLSVIGVRDARLYEPEPGPELADPGRAGETTVPAEETTAPAEETTAPAEETTAPAEETTAPAGGTTRPVTERAPSEPVR